MNKLEIIGTGRYLPPHIITNNDLSKIMDTSDEWIKVRTGIGTRRYAYDELPSEMAIKAAKKAIENAKINPKDIDLIIVATISGDNITPSVACKLITPLGLNNIMAFDINAACSGFIYALNVASSIVTSNNYKNALVIGVEKLSNIIDFSDRSTAILFGDGAAACIIKNTDNNAYFSCFSKTDVENVLYAKGITHNELLKNSTFTDYYLKMNGQEVYKFAISASILAMNDVLAKANLDINDISLIIPHQANIRIIDSIAKKLNLDHNKFYINVDKYGNTSAASVPIALDEAYEKKLIKKGDKVLLVGFGAGLTYAAAIFEV